MIKKLDFYGIPVSSFESTELFNLIDSIILEKKRQLVIYGFSLGTISRIKYEPQIFLASKDNDIFLTDGRNFYYLLKLFGFEIKCKLSIPEFVYLLLSHAEKNKYKLMLLGATDQVNHKATENIKKNYPRLQVCDGADGYFSEDQEPELVERVKDSAPDILLVGISSPKKEIFVDKWKRDIQVPIIVPCGGMIDVLAGVTRITPRFIKNLGLAWAYRLIQEPRRLSKPLFQAIPLFLFVIIPKIFFSLITKRPFSIPGSLIEIERKPFDLN